MDKKDESIELFQKNECLDKITNIINTTKKLREDKEEKNFLKNVKSILNNFYHAFWDEEIFEEIITFLNIFNEEIPKTINDFYYSTFCCKRKDSKQLYEKIDELTFITNFRTNKIYDIKITDSFLKYYYQFLKRKKIFY